MDYTEPLDSGREPLIYDLYFFLSGLWTNILSAFYENKHINDVEMCKYDLCKIISC